MNGPVIAGVQRPPLADEPAAEENLEAIRPPVRDDTQPRDLTPESDLDRAGRDARFAWHRRAVDREERSRAGTHVNLASPTEQHERWHARKARIDGVAPHAVLRDPHGFSN